uniref:dCMP deaminase n=1 Tax=Cenarchaeum symbiosum TaxID=46770 RepID=O74069_CENSM|nr:dCMP deaminase [Cenarchaeum symbiosum]
MPGGGRLPVSGFERPTWDEYFMLQAELAKLRSNCIVRKVGAVIVRDHRQLATGYNGTPPGVKNCYEGGCERCAERIEGRIKSGEALDRCLCNHAEANAIMHCAILGIGAGGGGATMYTTFSPCLECTKMAVTIGIRRFVCLDTYPENTSRLVKETSSEITMMDKEKISYWASRMPGGSKEVPVR